MRPGLLRTVLLGALAAAFALPPRAVLAERRPDPAADPEGIPDDDATGAASQESRSAPQPTTARKAPRRKARKKARRRAGAPLLHASLGRNWRIEVPVRFGLSAGWQRGRFYRPVEGATVEIAVGVAPEFRWRGDRFRARLQGGYQQISTPGFDLPQRAIRGGLALSGRPHRAVEIEAGARVRLVQRPGWPDFYQPVLGDDGMPSGSLLPTDRYGFLEVEAQAGIRWQVATSFALSGAFGWRQRTYAKDPAYDGLLNPTHLVPFDRDRWRGEIEAEGRVDRWTGTLRARLDALSDPFAFARDAGTGLTHSPPGGTPANPLQRFLRVEVRHRSDLRIPEARTRLSLVAGWERNHDRFQGYYDWDDLLAGVSVRSRPWRGLVLQAGWDGRFRWHGDGAYRAGPGHPPLEGGDSRRTDRWNRLRARAGWAAWEGRIEPFVEAEFRWHHTNFPDYVPGVNPPGQPYRIDFDYANRAVRAGVDVAF